MMAYSEDHIALAAEYALGTLDADERAQVETMMSVDKDFTAMVEAWEHKLGVLNQMVGSVEPRPEVWDRIRAAVGHCRTAGAAACCPKRRRRRTPQPGRCRSAPAVCRCAVVRSTSNVIQLSAQARRWRNIATLDDGDRGRTGRDDRGQAYQPDLLPDGLRPKPRTQVVEVKAPAAPAPPAQYVAVLQKDGGSPAFILTVDGATRNFTVRKVGAAAEPGKSLRAVADLGQAAAAALARA